MASTAARTRTGAIHPFNAAVLAGAFPLFLSALIADYAYWTTHQIAWSNFASWLLVGAMIMTSIALVCEIAALVRGHRNFTSLLVLASTWVVGFFDALHHVLAPWHIMPPARTLTGIPTV